MHVTSREEKGRLIELWMAEYGTELLRMNYLYLKDRQLAEDVTQETFLKAFRQLDSFRGESSPKTWLVRIAINLCKDEWKRAWNRLVDAADKDEAFERGLQDTEQRGRGSEARTPEEQAMEKQRSQELLCGVMDLTDKSKEVILLYYYQELSLGEIAEILEIPEDTVSTRLRRARLQLKEKLKGWWENEREIG